MRKDLFDIEDFNFILGNALIDSSSFLESDHYLEDISLICELFSHSKNSKALPRHLEVFNPPREIWDELIIFPGTFSPWHKGHGACVEGCDDRPVLIIPDFNPWKKKRESNPWRDLAALYNFIRESKKEKIYIYTGFLIKNEANPTINWLPHLPLKKKRLLLGDDSFLSLYRWKDAHSLMLCLDELYICPRQGDHEELVALSKKITKEYKLKLHLLEKHDYQGFSSTSLREKL